MRIRIITTLILTMGLIPRIAVADEFQPVLLDLKSSTQLALRTSPQIGSACASAEITRAQLGKAKSALYPNVSFESNYNYLSKETLFGTTPVWKQDTLDNRLVLRQTICSGGAVSANIDSARQGYEAAGYGARAVQADVITNVSVAYFRARQAKEQTDVAQASVKSLQASYDDAKKLHDAGMVTNSDVLRAKVALTSAQESVIRASNNYNITLASLRSSIGLSQAASIDLAPNACDAAPDAAIAATPAQRPEIASGSASIRAADAGKKAALAQRLPTLSLAADYFNEPAGAEFPRRSDTVLAGVIVKFNVFDGGLVRSNINEADAAARKAREDLEAQKRQVELEQQAARLDLDSACARVQTTSDQIESAEESFRALQTGYKEGMTPLTDVLSAESALTSARANRLAALYDVKIAQVNLLRAYGQTDVLTR